MKIKKGKPFRGLPFFLNFDTIGRDIMKIYNKRDNNIPSDAVYVGRPTKWGNQWSHLSYGRGTIKVSSREEAIECYRSWIVTQDELIKQAKVELRGKDLICWCAPQSCHADVLLEIANT